MVERIIEEVFKIPEFFDHSGVREQSQRTNLPQFDPKKYEELLATAVLNKVFIDLCFTNPFMITVYHVKNKAHVTRYIVHLCVVDELFHFFRLFSIVNFFSSYILTLIIKLKSSAKVFELNIGDENLLRYNVLKARSHIVR